jgi:hypothetical protein
MVRAGRAIWRCCRPKAPVTLHLRLVWSAWGFDGEWPNNHSTGAGLHAFGSSVRLVVYHTAADNFVGCADRGIAVHIVDVDTGV